MKNTMKHFVRFMLSTLAIGVVAVVLASLVRHPAVAHATAFPVPNSLVTLSTGPMSSGAGPACLQQVLPDGDLAGACYSVPAKTYLVVTDVNSYCLNTGGADGFTALSISPFSGSTLPYSTNFPADSTMAATLHDHLTTGVVFSAFDPYAWVGIGYPIQQGSMYCTAGWDVTVQGFSSVFPPTAPPFQ